MAEEVNAPAAVEASKDVTRSSDAPEESSVVDAKAVNGGDVVAESAVAEGLLHRPCVARHPSTHSHTFRY